MKWVSLLDWAQERDVAPHAGAWIEIARHGRFDGGNHVAPHAGAWIEIKTYETMLVCPPSPPTRGRGLKWLILQSGLAGRIVAPHAGAWIEISRKRHGAP